MQRNIFELDGGRPQPLPQGPRKQWGVFDLKRPCSASAATAQIYFTTTTTIAAAAAFAVVLAAIAFAAVAAVAAVAGVGTAISVPASTACKML